MRKIMYYIVLSTLLISLCCCDKKTTEPDDYLDLSSLSGPTILYSLAGEDFIENRINNSNSDTVFLSDNYPIRNIRICPNKEKIAYIKNSVWHPYFGVQNIDIPSVNISTDLGETEVNLFEYDEQSILFVEWIDSEKLVLSSKEGSQYFLTVINTEGEILIRHQVSDLFLIRMLPDQQHLIAYNSDKFGILNVTSYDFQEFNPDEEISAYHQPFYIESAVIIKLFDNEYIKFDLIDFTYESFPLINNDDRLVFANSNFYVYYNYNDSELKLYDGIEIISTVNIDGYNCEVGLGITVENKFYFVGESLEIDDESVIINVNFDSNQLYKLTNHGEDNFISEPKYYDF